MFFGNDKRAKTNAINIIESLTMTCKEEYKDVLKNNKG